jgi:hypothetical protein
MKKIIKLILLFTFLFASVVLAADIQLNSSPIEIGDKLPMPYDCLEYRGHNTVAALYATGCPDKGEGWLYIAINTAGQFVFIWNGQALVLQPTGKGQNQVNLYRRTP